MLMCLRGSTIFNNNPVDSIQFHAVFFTTSNIGGCFYIYISLNYRFFGATWKQTKTISYHLCINRYLPELDINNIKETLLKSGVTFFNLHRISYLHNKNIKIKNRDYIKRKYTEKPRQDYRYRYANFAEKPHPSTRFRKETNTAEKTNIENTNYQKMLAENLAEITRRLELIEEILKLKKTLHDLRLTACELIIKTETMFISRIRAYTEKMNSPQINSITKKLTISLQLDEIKSAKLNRILVQAFRLLGLVNLPLDIDTSMEKRKKELLGSDKGP